MTRQNEYPPVPLSELIKEELGVLFMRDENGTWVAVSLWNWWECFKFAAVAEVGWRKIADAHSKTLNLLPVGYREATALKDKYRRLSSAANNNADAWREWREPQ